MRLPAQRTDGEPRIEKLKPVYAKALNILNKMPVKKDFVTEQEATKFSQDLAQEMAAHPSESVCASSPAVASWQ